MKRIISVLPVVMLMIMPVMVMSMVSGPASPIVTTPSPGNGQFADGRIGKNFLGQISAINVNQYLMVGDDSGPLNTTEIVYRGFLGFDISTILAGEVIQSAVLRLSLLQGTSSIGEVLVDLVDFGTSLDAADYDVPALTANIGTFSAVGPSNQYQELDVTVAVLAALGQGTVQFRLRATIEQSQIGQNIALFNDTENSAGNGQVPQLVITLGSPNQPPALMADNASPIVNEDQSATNTGTVSDPDDDAVTLIASVGTVNNNGDGTWSWGFTTNDGPAQSQIVTISADDGNGGVAETSFSFTVNNVAPSVDAITIPNAPVDISSQPIVVSASFSDPAGTYDEPYTCAIDYGDGSGPQAGTVSGMACSGSHTYASAGVYVVTVAVTDKDNDTGSSVAGHAITIYDFTDIVLFSTNSIWLKQGADVLSGTVTVNDASPGPVLDSQVELSVGENVTIAAGFAIKANRIKVKQGATVNSEVFYNTLTNNGTITGTQHSPLALPLAQIWPQFQSAPPGTQDIEVAQNGALTLAAGDYGSLVVRSNGTVIFTGGIYNFRSIDSRDRTNLLFAASTEVRVADKFDSDLNVCIGPQSGSGINASNIVFYVAGINGGNGNLGATPRAAQIGLTNTIAANFYVPNGTIWLRKNTHAAGAFVARDIIIGDGVQLSLESYFANNGAAQFVARDRETARRNGPSMFAEAVSLPRNFALEQNYPNPFNPSTTFAFDLPQATQVKLTVYSITGQEVAVVVNGMLNAGHYTFTWQAPANTVSGVYLYKLETAEFTSVKKMIFQK